MRVTMRLARLTSHRVGGGYRGCAGTAMQDRSRSHEYDNNKERLRSAERRGVWPERETRTMKGEEGREKRTTATEKIGEGGHGDNTQQQRNREKRGGGRAPNTHAREERETEQSRKRMRRCRWHDRATEHENRWRRSDEWAVQVSGEVKWKAGQVCGGRAGDQLAAQRLHDGGWMNVAEYKEREIALAPP